MLNEKTLEEKILTKIEAALPASAPRHIITGFWQPSAPGKLKGLDDDRESVALIEVSTGLGNQPTFSEPTVSFSVSVQLTIRVELDPEGNHLLTFVEPINNLFRSWMSATYQKAFTDFDTTALIIDEVSVSGGSPIIDTTTLLARVKWDLTLSGSYL